MKHVNKAIVLALMLFTVCLAWAAFNTKVKLEWDYPPEEVPGMTFNIYYSTNPAAPLSSWTRITNVNSQTNIILPLIPIGQHFYTCTASNEIWGESDFSNVATTGPVPRSGGSLNLKIKGLQ